MLDDFKWVLTRGHVQGGAGGAQCVELLLEGDEKSKKRVLMGFLPIFG